MLIDVPYDPSPAGSSTSHLKEKRWMQAQKLFNNVSNPLWEMSDFDNTVSLPTVKRLAGIAS